MMIDLVNGEWSIVNYIIDHSPLTSYPSIFFTYATCPR